MIERIIDSNGVQIQVYESVNKIGEVILFLHPQGSTSNIWGNMVTIFENDYYVLLMDLRGQGKSEIAKSGYDILTQCKDIISVLDQMKVHKAHLVGNSLGGDIATAFASMFPERVLSLTNIDSGMIDYIGEEGERNLSKEQVIDEFLNRDILSFPTKTEMIDHVKSIFPIEIWKDYFELWFNFVSTYELENGRISYQIPPKINAQIMEMVCDLHYKELYRTITCPILFLPAEMEDHLQMKLKNIGEANKYTYTKKVYHT